MLGAVLTPVPRMACAPVGLSSSLVFPVVRVGAQVLALPAAPALALAGGLGTVVLVGSLQAGVKDAAAGHAAAGSFHDVLHARTVIFWSAVGASASS
jgi:hypothetical protein